MLYFKIYKSGNEYVFSWIHTNQGLRSAHHRSNFFDAVFRGIKNLPTVLRNL